MLAWVLGVASATTSDRCADGSAIDCVLLAERTERRDGPAAAAAAWRRACDLGVGEACLALARHVAAGRVVTAAGTADAIVLRDRACRLRVPQACHETFSVELAEAGCRTGDPADCRELALAGPTTRWGREVSDDACARGLVPCDLDPAPTDPGRDGGAVGLDLLALGALDGAPLVAGVAFDAFLVTDGVVVRPAIDLAVGSGFRHAASFALGAGWVAGRALTLGLDAGPAFDLLTPEVGPTMSLPVAATALAFPHPLVALAVRPRLGWTLAGPIDRRERSPLVPLAHELAVEVDLWVGAQGADRLSLAPHLGLEWRHLAAGDTVSVGLGVGGTDRAAR